MMGNSVKQGSHSIRYCKGISTLAATGGMYRMGGRGQFYVSGRGRQLRNAIINYGLRNLIHGVVIGRPHHFYYFNLKKTLSLGKGLSPH